MYISLAASGKESKVWGRQNKKNNFFSIVQSFIEFVFKHVMVLI